MSELYSLIYPIVARKDAIAQGLQFYFTGKLCIHGHLCDKRTTGGCVNCTRARKQSNRLKARLVYRQNKVKINKERREYRQNNKAHINELSRKYYHKNKDNVTQIARDKYQENKQQMQQQTNEYRLKNKDHINARSREYKRKNKDYIKEQRRLYIIKNQEKVDKMNKDYYQKNSHLYIEGSRIRLTKLKNAIPSWNESEKELIKTIYQKSNELSRLWNVEFTVDHIIPLNPRDKSVSGLHCWYNLQLLESKLNKQKRCTYQVDW